MVDFDVIVIGGGPAGMMAAGTAAANGKRVLLLEKNANLGKKLLITGGGRCNVTNIRTDLEVIYKEGGKYLHSPFSQLGAEQTVKFFNDRGMKTKVEPEGRVFPFSDSSQSVLDVLVRYMEEGHVKVRCGSVVSGIDCLDGIFRIRLAGGENLSSNSCILATGGISRPETGSTGEGFDWMRQLGHKIIDNDYALVPVALKDKWAKKLSGVSFQEVRLTGVCDGVRGFTQKGKILFTHFGISGPTVLNLSKKIGEMLQEGPVVIYVDFFPNIDHGALRLKLNSVLQMDSNKMLKNSLGKVVGNSLVDAVLESVGVSGDVFGHSVSKESRSKIVHIVKEMPLNVLSLLGSDKAIVSSGGVDLNEVNFKTMESKIIPNLHLVGDVLNIDRPSGGFSLQLCWTTGFVAGSHCR